ncbi:hypothetical protein NLJ89_g6304 [Agrocybe chaxingu]|uniref:Nephrocystin 3-like N-terminal domain-containing protein n=1 Tax=Agrocybe chaxingu TaxID=84603 RepID=A0A9W8K6P1_9AGAR|nr:hypothetical protein NLJ89_g6304 [Agrocybe chaxingu]
MDWITNDSQQPSILVLHGSAGAGKSALEQTIAQRCQQEGRLASSFFLSRTAVNARRSDGNAVIPTLVYQHIQVFPWLKERVLEEIRMDPGIFERSREVQLDRLLVKHFQALPVLSNDTRHRLISIDGLDECDDRHVQQDLLRIIAATLTRLRHPFRFFIACRPESHLMQVINGDPLFQNNRIYCIDLGGDTQVDADIRLFLCNRFRKIRETHPVRRFLPQPWPGESVINKLVVNASGQFIYADTVMRFLESLSHSPEDQLDIILAIAPPRENENPFAQLDALYTHIFSLVKDRDTVWRVLGVIYLAAQDRIFEITKMDHAAIAYPAFLERLFKCRRGTVHLALGELPSVISIVSDNTPIKVLHASLFDFLLDPTRSGAYTLDLALAHESLAMWRYRDINFQGNGLPIAFWFQLLSYFDLRLGSTFRTGMAEIHSLRVATQPAVSAALPICPTIGNARSRS